MKRDPVIERKFVDIAPKAGIVPPHDLDAEAAILSACMLAFPAAGGLHSSTAYFEVADVLKPEMFYSEKHLQIFDAIRHLANEQRPIDVVTVMTLLKDRQRLAQIGGSPYLNEILDSAPVIRNVRDYAEKVRALYRRRMMILTLQRKAAQAYGDVGGEQDFLEEVATEVATLAQSKADDRTVGMLELMRECYGKTKAAYEQGRPPGISTGLRGFDSITSGGLRRGELTIVAARPGVGKTAYMLSIARNVVGSDEMIIADDGKPWSEQACVYFSLEMQRDQIGNRLLSFESGVPATRIRSGKLEVDDWAPFTQAAHTLAPLPLKVNDASGLAIESLRARVRMLKLEFEREKRPDGVTPKRRLAALFFDYLQLGKADARTRIEEIGKISRGLKELAKDEEIAVIAGCQLNRSIESRSGVAKRPVLSDLRESGDIEQDADNVIGLFRGAYYGEADPEGEEGRTEQIWLKQRGGPTGMRVCRFTPETMLFDDMPGQY